MHCADGTSGSKTAITGEIPAKSCCRVKSGRLSVFPLGHPTDGHKGVQRLAAQQNETWKAVAFRFEENVEVHVCNYGKYPSLTISSLEKLEEPPSLLCLSSRVRQLLPPVDLTELLIEIDARTGFTREFMHVSESGGHCCKYEVGQDSGLIIKAYISKTLLTRRISPRGWPK